MSPRGCKGHHTLDNTAGSCHLPPFRSWTPRQSRCHCCRWMLQIFCLHHCLPSCRRHHRWWRSGACREGWRWAGSETCLLQGTAADRMSGCVPHMHLRTTTTAKSSTHQTSQNVTVSLQSENTKIINTVIRLHKMSVSLYNLKS